MDHTLNIQIQLLRSVIQDASPPCIPFGFCVRCPHHQLRGMVRLLQFLGSLLLHIASMGMQHLNLRIRSKSQAVHRFQASSMMGSIRYPAKTFVGYCHWDGPHASDSIGCYECGVHLGSCNTIDAVSVHNASIAVPSSPACHSVGAAVGVTPAYALHVKAGADAMRVNLVMQLVHECSVTMSVAH